MRPGFWPAVFALIAGASAAPDTLELSGASARGRRPIAGPATVHRLDREELRRFASLEEALDALPGFRVRRQGGLGGYSELSFRGARSGAVDIYLDGIRLNQDGDAAPDLSKWPLLWFSSVTARSGMNPDGTPPGSLARVDLSTGGLPGERIGFQSRIGSFSTAEAAAGVSVGSDWKWTLGAQGQRSRNDYSFFSDNGTIYNPGDDGLLTMDNNAYWSRGIRAAARRESRSGDQSFSLLGLDYRKEYPGIFPTTARAFTRRQEWLGAWRLRRFAGAATWEAGLQARRFEDAYRDPGQSLGYLSYEEARTAFAAEAETRLRVPLQPRMDLNSDLKLRLENVDPVRTPFTQPVPAPAAQKAEAQIGAALGTRISEAVTATIEGRGIFSRFHTEDARSFPNPGVPQPMTRTRVPMAGRAGAEWRNGTGTLGLLARLEQRAPSSSELLGDNHGIRENLDLRLEETSALSLFHAWTHRAWLSRTSVFLHRYSDPIRLRPYGSSPFLRYENGAAYRALGLEQEARREGRFVEAGTAFTWQDLRITQGPASGNRPAYQSPLEARGDLAWKPFPALRLGSVLDFRGPYYPGDINLPDARRSPEWDWSAHAEARLSRARLAFDARNLLDRYYRDFAYSVRGGRNYSLSFSFTL